MKLSKALSAAAAASLVVAPIAAQAAPATVEGSRIGTDVEGENLRGGFLIPLVAIVLIILGILAMTGGDGDEPTTP